MAGEFIRSLERVWYSPRLFVFECRSHRVLLGMELLVMFPSPSSPKSTPGAAMSQCRLAQSVQP